MCRLGGKGKLLKEVVNNLTECVTIDYPGGTWPGKKFSHIVPGGRGKHEFDEEKCVGCASCRNVCPNYTISIIDQDEKRKVSVFLGRCMFCGRCMFDCPEEAIKLTPQYEFANTSKDGLYVKNTLERRKCKNCGSYLFPDKQLKRARERVLAEIDERVRDVFEQDTKIYLDYCSDCRKKLGYVMNTNTRKYY